LLADANPLDGVTTSVDGRLASFCSGNEPKMILNGEVSTPTVTARKLAMSCCDGVQLAATAPAFGHTVFFGWQVTAGPASTYPAAVDLANPEKDWSARVYLGCDASTTSCSPPPDSYTSGLEGSLQVQLLNETYAFDTSLCLRVVEPTGSPHPLLHSLELYVPNVTAR
jgi:hypothetical protein